MSTQPTVAAAIPQWTTGDRLRKAREFSGLTQRQLADEIGVSNRSISAYEQGATARRPVLLSWAVRTGVPLEWLQTGSVNSGWSARRPGGAQQTGALSVA